MEKNIIPILMPKWGLTMEEGQVNEWLVKEGEEISVGDEIIEVETDKITGAVNLPLFLLEGVAVIGEVFALLIVLMK